MGNTKGEFDVELSLVGLERCQIRHQALEAARVASNRDMTKTTGRQNYHLRIRVKPYHYLRENKMISGAGADRVQDGMRKAWTTLDHNSSEPSTCQASNEGSQESSSKNAHTLQDCLR